MIRLRDGKRISPATMSCRIRPACYWRGSCDLAYQRRIAGQHVDTLRSLLEQERHRVALDLKDVLLVDREAVKLLAFHESNGAELRNCLTYIREWVTKEADTNAAE